MSDKVKRLLSEEGFKFNLPSLLRYAPHKKGIYSFWYNFTPIYVGVAIDQFLIERLKKYYSANIRYSDENQSLIRWIYCHRRDDKFKVRTLVLDNYSKIKILQAEKYYIKQLFPIANIQHRNY